MAGSEREHLAPGRREAPRRPATAGGAGGLRGGVLRLQALVGNRGVTRLLARSEDSRLPPRRAEGDIVRDLNATGTEINDNRDIAEDLLEDRGLARTKAGLDEATLKTRLGELAANGDEKAADVLKELNDLGERRNGLIEELGRAQAGAGPHVDAGAGKEKFETPQEEELASEKPPPASAEPRGAATTGEDASAETASPVAGEAAGRAAEAFLPTPIDALMLLWDFAGTYKEARRETRGRAMRSGFAQGVAAGLLGLGPHWVIDNLAPRSVSVSVASEVAGTTGVYEQGYATGLAAGFKFAAKLPQAERSQLMRHATKVTMIREHLTQGFLKDWWVAGYSTDNVINIADSLLDKVDEMFAQAEAREAEIAEIAALRRSSEGTEVAAFARSFWNDLWDPG